MKSFIATLSLILVSFTFIPSAHADHGDRFCRIERRGQGGMLIYYGYGYSRQSSHYGPHYHTNYIDRSRYYEDCNRNHRYSRSGGIRLFLR